MNLVENLQKQRKAHGLSQEELAEKCGISRQAIAKWESGNSLPSIETLILLADLYEMSLDELVGRAFFDDYDHLAAFVGKHIPREVLLEEHDDALPILIRFFNFMSKMNISAEDTLKGMKEVFLGIDADEEV